jgi:predicted ATPase
LRARILALYEPALRGIPGADATPRLFAESAMDFRTQLYLAIAETLEALADAEPVLLVIDDLQWGDELTIGFLEMALRGDRFARSALLVLGTFRSEEVSPSLVALVDAAGGDVAELERLTDDEIAAIAGDMLSTIPPPATLARLICDRAAGNPFFAAEYLRAAVDEGLLRRDSNGRWITTDSSPTIEEIALPPTLRELLELRIRGLSAPSSQVAAALAVLGRDADVALVERMLGSDDLSHALTDLIRRHVVEESRPGRLGFAHDKLRELSYEGLGGPDRVRLHRAAAEALEASGLAWRGATLAELGHHWEIAGEPDKAARYYLSGAKASAARYALSEAARLYSAYFRIAPSNTAERADAHGRFGRTVLRPQGLVAETAREYEIALEEARSAGARTIEGVVLRWRGALLYETGRLDDAAVDYAAALEIARGLHDREAEGRALTNLGALAHERGRLEEAADLYERALSVKTNLSAAITNLALLRQQQGRLDDARALYRGALAAASDRGDLVTEATVAMNLAILEKESGQFDAAAARYDQALALARSTGNRRMEGMVLGNRADLQWDAGELDAARTLYVQALAIHREVGNRRFEGVVLSNLATAYAEHGDLDAARSAYRDALVIHRDVGDRRFVGITLTEQATLERRAGDLDDAELLLGEAERVVNEIGEKLHRALALCARAHLELANGRSATPEIEAARALADDLGARAESHLGRTVAAAERAHQAFDSGATLRFGEVAADSGRN